MGQAEHKHHAGGLRARVQVVTVSDTRTPDTDESGTIIKEALALQGHAVAGYALLKDEPLAIAAEVRRACGDAAVDVVIVNGGTGISTRDATFEAIDALLERRIPGFGELFRFLSFREIGSAAMLSRATAGIVAGKLVFVMPGSANAVKLAMTKLVLPELSHALWELRR